MPSYKKYIFPQNVVTIENLSSSSTSTIQINNNDNIFNHDNTKQNDDQSNQVYMAVNFVSTDQKIQNYCQVCKNTDSFEKLKVKLYKDFPHLNKNNVLFQVNARNIDTSKSLEENKIKNNDVINVFVF